MKRKETQQRDANPKPFKKKIEDEPDWDEEEDPSVYDASDHMEPDLPVGGESTWARPAAPTLDPSKDGLCFQQMDIDYILGEPLEGMPGNQKGTVPILRTWGLTENGNSVQCNIHGYTPYFYIPAPSGFSENDCEPFRKMLNNRVASSTRDSVKVSDYVLEVSIENNFRSIMHYTQNRTVFLKICVAIPKLVPTARSVCESDFTWNGRSLSCTTYESNILFPLRFMIDKGIVGASWINLKAGTYRMTPQDKRTTNCQIEVDASFDMVEAHAPEGEWSKLAPFRILSFDIECAGRKGVFPEAEHDPVIQIANVVTIQGEATPSIKNVFNLRSCSDIVGAQVLAFEDERELLRKWRRFVVEVDPDIIIGYNIANFDFPYLMNRAKHLKVDEFPKLGRVKSAKARVRDTTFSSKAYGTRESKETSLDGRVQLDILQAIQRDHKLSSYSLNSVSAKFLGEQKEDVHYSIISDLYNGSDDDRRRLAVYCLKDAVLPLRLLDTLMITYNYIEMARVTGVPISYLLARGQQIKVVSQLYRKAKQMNLVIPVIKSAHHAEDSFAGATVLEPQRGFHQEPISSLDFSSLYPSIMMAHNLCYSTLLNKQDLSSLPPGSYVTTPTGDHFVKSEIRKGVLPIILEELLSARKRAKDDLKNENDPFKRAVLDGRQLALKVSANSVYGFTGATVGKLPCLAVSASVTGYGRDMLLLTRKYVEERFTKLNGYSHDANIVYGDTDSVMVKFGTNDIEEAIKLGKEAANYISEKFQKPIKLEFEKVYYPYLLINKKRYAGLLWTRAEKYDKIDVKGIETVRRDNCPVVKNVINTCLQKILIDRDVDGAIKYTKGVISDLLQNKLDLSLLVISKALSKEGKEYANKQAHAELAERMRKRDPHTAPAIGDRVPYVIIQAAKDAKAYEKAEDPLWVLDNNIPLDYQYYLDNQLRKPIERLFAPIMGNPGQLLSGDHTRTVFKPTPKQGGIIAFAVKQLSCLGCKAPLKNGETTVCRNCTDREAELYQNVLNNVSNLEKQFAKVWTQCQVCQGSLHQPVLCTSRDCPIFYMRKKVQKELGDVQQSLERFTIAW
ncbi:DNA polymerase delta catalytic subunit-like [Planoprotostelium fungivorum]|uniref:DNA polymerase n=1 Tax=Planoprotostelium fungivorum TaxID=1890364 RepID=A0A2P6NG84_9EUKA|nr:DNA polymerase delta catalytic subunit-like [Planoprotostelium fungivorum]